MNIFSRNISTLNSGIYNLKFGRVVLLNAVGSVVAVDGDIVHVVVFLVVAVNVDILLVCADVDPIPDKQRCQQNISQFSQNLPSISSLMGGFKDLC